MKESIYNFWVNTDKGSTLLFNGRTGALVEITESDELIKIKQSLLGQENSYTQDLLKLGFLWDKNVDEFESIIVRRDVVNANEPLEITISPTYGCNFRCTYCYVCFDDYQMTEETELNVVKYIDNAFSKFNIINVSWFGGEPLLMWERIVKINNSLLEIANKHNATINLLLTTNGYLLTEKVMDKLYESGLRWIHVTIDGCDQGQDTRRVTANGKGTYKKVLSNFISAMRKFPDLHGTLRMNLEPDSIDNAHALLEVIPEDLRKKIQVHPTPVILENVIRESSFFTDVAKVVTHALDSGYAYYDNDIPIGRRGHCNAEFENSFQIGPKGELHKCSPSNKPEVTVGEISVSGEAKYNKNNKIWNDAKKIENRCKNCKFLCFCQGGCRLNRVRGKVDERCKEPYQAINQHVINYWKAKLLKKI